MKPKNNILNQEAKKISCISFVYILVFFSVLGSQALAIEFAGIQLSPFRAFVLIFPLVIFGAAPSFLNRIRDLISHQYINMLLFWLVYSIFTILWACDYSAWFKTLIFYMLGVFSSAFVFLYLNDIKDLVGGFKVVVFLSVLIGMIAIYEMISGNYWFLDDLNLEFYSATSASTSLLNLSVPITIFGNPNNYALFLFFSIVFSAALCMLNRKSLMKLAYFTAGFFFYIILLATQSRAGNLGALIFIAGLLLYKAYHIKSSACLYILITILFLASLIFLDLSYFINMLESLFTFDFNGSELGSDYVRMNLIKNGFIFLINTYGFGVGIGQIEYYMEFSSVYDTAEITNMHNLWADILVSSGLVVFLVYIFIYGRTLCQAFSRIRSQTTNDIVIINVVSVCFMISFIPAAVGPSSVLLTEWFWPLFALMMKIPFVSSNLPSCQLVK